MQNFLLLLSYLNCIFNIEQREIRTSHYSIWDQNLHTKANILSFMFLQWAFSADLFSCPIYLEHCYHPTEKKKSHIFYTLWKKSMETKAQQSKLFQGDNWTPKSNTPKTPKAKTKHPNPSFTSFLTDFRIQVVYSSLKLGTWIHHFLSLLYHNCFFLL